LYKINVLTIAIEVYSNFNTRKFVLHIEGAERPFMQILKER